jgi:hypothetical protein
MPEHSLLRSFAVMASCGILGFLSFVDISNKYVDVLRVKYVKEQLETNQRHVNYILLPYKMYLLDSAYSLDTDFYIIELDGKDYCFDELYFKYNDVDPSVLDKVRIDIGMYDYHMNKES